MIQRIFSKSAIAASLIVILTTGTLTLVLVTMQNQYSFASSHNSGNVTEKSDQTLDLHDADLKNNSSDTVSPNGLPERAIGPAIPQDKGYLVEPIKDNLYWVSDGTYNTMFMVTENGVIAVDAPPTMGEKYIKAIRDVTENPITHVIYSHSHLDHIGAAGIFPTNATFIAHQEVTDELTRAQGLSANNSLLPTPTQSFTDKFTLRDGKNVIELDYHGNNHVPGNIFIYAPGHETLMVVDVVFPGWVPFQQLAIAKDVAGFIKAHDIILDYEFDTFVGGHLTRLGTQEDVAIQKEFVMDLFNASATAIKSVNFQDIAMSLQSNDQWLIFQTYSDALADACVEEMVPKWEDRLGGAEAFMRTHCWAMTESLNVEPSVSAMR